ncbi:MAG: efflux RND transporter periplasmic adaptor subunit [Gammaproteobacteria bacterium]|nr:efflux RND transporter periplasmic adaptor subunit [Gammaproteobacteria bacterium]
MRPIPFLATLPMIPLLLTGCTADHDTATLPAAATIQAETLVVTPEQIGETYTTTGTLVADDRVEIASRLMGYIRDIKVREGSQVKQGQLLLTIDPTEIEAQRAEAEARVSQARARSVEARADFERYKTLFEQKLVAANTYTKAELENQVAEEELRAALATLDRVKVQIQYAEIRSPVSGVVVEKLRRTGDLANPGAVILTVENPSNIVLDTYIREDQLRHVQPGDELAVSVDAVGLRTTGVVTQVVPSGDAATHSYLVKASLHELNGARSGMFARSEFTTGTKWTVLVPDAALVNRADLPGVYIVDREGIARFRMVRVGRHIDGRTEIISGLAGGERIVIASDAPVRTGDRVADKPAPAAESRDLAPQ